MTATARRGHGEGSVYRDATNGTWVGAISLGWRPDGSRIALLAAAKDHPRLGACVILSLTTGIRTEEARGAAMGSR